MPVQYQRESLADVWDCVAGLVADHATSRRPFADIPVEIDADRYEAVERAGALRIYTARDYAERSAPVVGYAIFFLSTHHHHRQSKQAVHDSWYVAPEFRAGLVGVHLLKFAEADLRADGAEVVTGCSPMAHNIAPLLQRMGYQPVEIIYAKRLGV